MSSVKGLAKDTAIYGVSSIVGRFLNWLLVPLYVYTFPPAEFGVITNLYAYTALLLVILTYGMETGFFRFANDNAHDYKKVYSSSLISLWITSLLFVLIVGLFLHPISNTLGYGDSPSYVMMLAVILGLDALSALPFAYLRYLKRPIQFASIKMVSIGINIGFNLFFILLCPMLYKQLPSLMNWYDPSFGIGYIILSNLISSIFTLLALYPQLFKVPFLFDKKLLVKILRYSLPLLILGVAGIMNQTIDKILLPILIPGEAGKTAVGIYGANYKIAVVMVMFIQAFRYAYEPFIFAQNGGKENKHAYIQAMKYFIIFGLLIFLGVMLYMDILKHFIEQKYYSGLEVVPIVMLAELFFGIFFNLSLWYKLTDQTRWGAWLSLFGLIITIAGNLLFVPLYGFIACAWTALACYFAMMIFSYIMGRKHYPINYEIKSALRYISLTGMLYGASLIFPIENQPLRLIIHTLYLGVFVLYMIKTDLPLSQIPVINKLVKKRVSNKK